MLRRPPHLNSVATLPNKTVVTMKEWLKSMHFYQSFETKCATFLAHPVYIYTLKDVIKAMQ